MGRAPTPLPIDLEIVYAGYAAKLVTMTVSEDDTRASTPASPASTWRGWPTPTSTVTRSPTRPLATSLGVRWSVTGRHLGGGWRW
jgi:hypothetical protein